MLIVIYYTWWVGENVLKITAIASSYLSPPNFAGHIALWNAWHRCFPTLHINYKPHVVSRIIHVAWWRECTRRTSLVTSYISPSAFISSIAAMIVPSGTWYRTKHKLQEYFVSYILNMMKRREYTLAQKRITSFILPIHSFHISIVTAVIDPSGINDYPLIHNLQAICW